MYQFPETTFGTPDEDIKIKGNETKIWQERLQLVPVVSLVLYVSSQKTPNLSHKLGLPVELLTSSYSFFFTQFPNTLQGNLSDSF